MLSFSSLLASGLPSEVLEAQQKSYVTYTFPSTQSGELNRSVTILESRAVLSSEGTTGLRTWESSLHLADYLANEGQASIKQKHVLELGAGTGLLSIFCAKHLEARHAAATDGSELVVDALRENIFINGLEGDARISSAVLKWGYSLDVTQFADESPFDIVLGADVVRTAQFLILIKVFDHNTILTF